MIELRDVLRTDAKVVYNAWGHLAENFERLTAKPFQDLGDAKQYVAGLFMDAQNIALHIVSAGTVVGLVKATIVQHRAQIGYVVHKPYWGKGLATLAVQEIVSRLEVKPGIQRVWATCALDNSGSVRVLEKCGFQQEGVLRNWVVYPALGGQAVDNYCYVRASPLTG